MASAETVKQKIRSLTDDANAAVKGSYATLSEAVAALIAGYGQGGGDTILDDLVDIHAWKKYKPVSIEQTEYSQVTISYKNPGSSDYNHLNWSTVKYADSIQIVGNTMYLVNPTSFMMSDTSDNDVVLGKYIQTSYNDSFYYIPEDTTIVHSKSVYGSGQYIKAYTAFALSVSPEALLGYVVEDVETAYPEDGEQNGYRYEYQGIVKTGEGMDTSDATATAEDLAEGVTAYVNGQKVTGAIPVVTDGGSVAGAANYTALEQSGSLLYARSTYNATQAAGRDRLLRGSPTLTVPVHLRDFGNAAASDVAAGKTFTSANGLLVEGTAAISGNGTDTTDATATAADIAEGKTAYVNGVKLTGTHVCKTGSIDGTVHVWKRTMALDIVLGTAESVGIAVWYNSNVERTIQYADSVEIADGEVALVDPQSVTLTPSQYNSDFSYLKGKYVTCSNAIAYIPADGNIVGSKTTTAPIVTTIQCTNAQKVTVTDAADTTASYVASTDRTAYPDAGTQDGYTYEYYGSL